MIEVIERHEFDSVGRACSCGVLCGVACDELTYAQHLVSELVKAGYGKVRYDTPDKIQQQARMYLGVYRCALCGRYKTDTNHENGCPVWKN